ncbi:MAG: glycosyltransferase family 39 protein [Deltaproteobacteria bacterium]|nr:glycosyltransferase family 39 protein [Deltaproteobacteria bacterium]MBW2254184.1 glycosyltransferase family 39 protein [Deltaproteobacteria bacterium]
MLLGLYLLILCAGLALIATSRRLWFDELVSWYVTLQEGPGGVLRALLGGADTLPPIDYWIRQASISLFAESTLAFRLPSILAYAFGLLCLWSFARRRVSAAVAWMAALVPLATASLYYATEGRPYATLLFLQALSLLAWQRAVEDPKSRLWPLALFVSLGAAPLTHYFGVLNYLPVIGGEALRSLRAGGVSKRMVLPIGLALLPLALLPLFAQHALEMREAFWARGYGLMRPIDSYRFLLGDILQPVLLLMALGIVLALRGGPEEPPERAGFRAHELFAIFIQVSTPLVVLIMAIAYTNAMTHRYAIITCFGFALLSAHTVDRLERRIPRLVPLLLTVLLFWSGRQLFLAMEQAGDHDEQADLEASLAGAKLPVVVDNPQLFLQSYHYLPTASSDRLFYLSDREESRRRLGYDNDEIAIENLGVWVPLKNERFDAFTLREREFLVLADHPRGWLLARLTDENAELQLISRIGRLEVFHASLDSVGD